MACIPGVPIIVAKQSYLAQTASLPTTTVFTPTEDGEYRLAYYQTVSTPGAGLTGSLAFHVAWTDEYHANAMSWGATGALQAYGVSLAGGMMAVLHAVAGQPIEFTATWSSTDPSQTYDLFVTVVKE